MHITQVSAKNLKGRSFEYALTPKTVVVGANFTGKTAIIEAVRLVLKGHIPEIGKKSSATFELASGATMNVGLSLSDGGDLDRQYSMIRGSVKEEVTGDVDACDTPMLDAAAYFEMSERERIDYVFSCITMPEDKTPAGIVAQLQRLSFGEDHTKHIETAKADILDTVRAYFEKCDTVSDALTQLTGDKTGVLPALFTEYNARVTQTKGTAQILAELKLRAGDPSADTITDLENERSRVQGLGSEASAEYGRLNEQLQAATRNARRLRDIAQDLARPAPLPEVVPPAPSATGIEEAAVLLEELQAVLKEPVPPANSTKYDRLLKEHRDEEARGKALSKQCAAASLQMQQLNELKACPHCGGKGKNWDTNLRATIQKEIDRLVAETEESTENLAKLKSEGQTASQMFKDASAAFEKYRAAQIEANGLDGKLKNHTEAIAAHQRLVDSIRRSNLSAAENHKQRMHDLEAERDRLRGLAIPVTEEAVAAAQEKIDSIREKYQQLGGRLDAAKRLQRDLQLAQEAAEEHELAAAKLAVVKAFKASLLETKGELVATAFKVLLADANAIVGDILPSPLAFNEEKGEVGRWVPTGWVSHKTFSGTEKALAYVAVAAALAAKAPLRVLPLDELGRLTPDLQERVLVALSKAVDDGKLDQVIAIVPMKAEMAAEFAIQDLSENLSSYSVIVTEAKEAA